MTLSICTIYSLLPLIRFFSVDSTNKCETDKVMSAEVSSSKSTNDTVNEVKSTIVESGEVTDNLSLETENAKGDSNENEAISKGMSWMYTVLLTLT